MPIRRAFRALRSLIAGAPAEAPAPGAAAPATLAEPRRPAGRPMPRGALTSGAVALRCWTVGPYAVLASSDEAAAQALARLSAEPDAAVRNEAGRLRTRLQPAHDSSGDAVGVAV